MSKEEYERALQLIDDDGNYSTVNSCCDEQLPTIKAYVAELEQEVNRWLIKAKIAETHVTELTAERDRLQAEKSEMCKIARKHMEGYEDLRRLIEGARTVTVFGIEGGARGIYMNHNGTYDPFEPGEYLAIKRDAVERKG